MSEHFFPYQFDWRLVPFWLPFIVRPGRDGVRVDEDRLRASFGWLSVETPLENVTGGHITEHYRWYTGAGARLSGADDGLTFGTNHDRGVCIHFRDRVKGFGRRPHSALTVTVADCEGLVAVLGEAAPRA